MVEYVLIISLVALAAIFSLFLFSDSVINLIYKASDIIRSDEKKGAETKAGAQPKKNTTSGDKTSNGPLVIEPEEDAELAAIARDNPNISRKELQKARHDTKLYQKLIWQGRVNKYKDFILIFVGLAIAGILIYFLINRIQLMLRQAR